MPSKRPQKQRRGKQRLHNADKPGNSSQIKALAAEVAWRERKNRSTSIKWCVRLRRLVPLPSTGRILQAAGQSTSSIIQKMCSLGTNLRNLTTIFLHTDKWCMLDSLWDLTTVTLSFVDIVCDVTVLRQYYAKGYYGLFKAGCLIFVIAQLSYAFVFVCMYPPRRDTPYARIALFFKILPVAQLVPFFIWLQSFQIPAINDCLRWIDVRVPGFHSPSTDSHKTCQYIRMKFEKHAGFIGEAFSEAIPQCLLQTAAICMYPELASPLSIYSILTSISVVASKGYLFSYAAHLPTRVFNVLCIIADLLNSFATATWLFAGSSNIDSDGQQQPFLLHCFIRAARHGCLGAVALFCFLVSKEVWSDRRARRKTVDPWQVCFVFVQLLLLLLPGVVLLATLKLSLVPFCLFCSFGALDEENDAAFGFDDKFNKLLSPALPQAERERRICLVNVFSLFAEARISREGARSRDLPRMCLEDVCHYMFQRKFKHPSDEFANEHALLKQDPVLSLIEPAASGIPALRCECKKQQASWAELVRSFLAEVFPYLIATGAAQAGTPSISAASSGISNRVHAHDAWRSLPSGRHIAHRFLELYTDDFQNVPKSSDLLWLEIKQDFTMILGGIYEFCIQLWSLASTCCRRCLHMARKLSNATRQFCLLVLLAGNRWDKMLLVSAALFGACCVPQLLYFAGYTVFFIVQATLYPTARLGFYLWNSDEGSMDTPSGIQTLQTVLSIGFTLCLIALLALFPLIMTRHRDVVFFLRPGRLPGYFFRPAIADAMQKACVADAHSLQTYRSLLHLGLPSGVSAEVMAFVGPSNCSGDGVYRPVLVLASR